MTRSILPPAGSTVGRALRAAAVLAAIGPVALTAASLNVPNGSFELQVANPGFGGVDARIDSWQKAPKPDYFDEGSFGFLWDQTAGVFIDNNPYGNRDGAQATYVLSFPQVSLSQDYGTQGWNDATPSHAFNQTFQAGVAYELTVGVFGKSMMEGATLQISLYYRDGSDAVVTVGSTTATYSAAAFPTTGQLNLIDYTVSVPVVQAGDAWLGQNIGIKIESALGDGNGYWDVDNVRLTTVPEPATLGLVSVGFGALLLARRTRSVRQ